MRLAERICASSLGGKAFLCNSGTEANECAIKLVRKHAHGRGIAEPEIVVLEGAFHGRTMGAVSATPGMAANESFAPYLPGFVAVPRDDPEALRGSGRGADRRGDDRADPGRVRRPCRSPTRCSSAAREACDAAGALLVFDEIQTGMGRTGSLWAYEQTARAAGRDDHREGARRRPAGRRLRRRSRVRRHAPAGRPRLDLRRRAAGGGGRARGPRRDRRSRSAALGARAGRPAARGARGDGRRHTRSAAGG